MRSCRSTAFRSRSRTISTLPGCRPRRPARRMPTARATRRPWRDCARAGAIVIGKTNLDQFATGLVGTRSPYGIPRNPMPATDPRRVQFGLGGRGADRARAADARHRHRRLRRVPAALNNIVGLKPSLGLVSTAGVVPACRSLDCVSVFAFTVDDAMTALPAWPAPTRRSYSREGACRFRAFPATAAARRAARRQSHLLRRQGLGGSLRGRTQSSTAFGATLVGSISRRSSRPPGCSTRDRGWPNAISSIRNLLASSPDAIHPSPGRSPWGGRLSAADTFAALYRLQALRRIAERAFAGIDALVLPTAPTGYSTAQVLANPIELNTRLGTYTNFVNLLDLCGLAFPASIRPDGIPFGITLLAPAGQDALLASIGRSSRRETKLTLGAGRAAAAAGGARHDPARRRNRDRGGRRASFRNGAQRRAEGAGRTVARSNALRQITDCTRFRLRRRARHVARASGTGRIDRAGALGTIGGMIRPLRRCHPAAVVDRIVAPG